MNFGAGFNHALIKKNPLDLPVNVTFIEMGISDVIAFSQTGLYPTVRWSLHLANTAMTENKTNQTLYINHISCLIKKLPKHVQDNLISIGLHLTGSRFEGNGLLGGTEAYFPTAHNLKLAQHFIHQLHNETGLPIWIENAGLYSEGISYIRHSWEHAHELSKHNYCSLIYDVAHAVVEANNNQLSEDCVLGLVPWEKVIEIHLSGINHSPDGSMHDGHNQPIPDSVWKQFICLTRILSSLNREHDVFYTVEHTSPTWNEHQDNYYADFEKAKQLVYQATPLKNYHTQKKRYMESYLKKIIRGEVPLLETACTQRGFDFNTLFSQWLEHNKLANKRITFNYADIPPHEIQHHCELVSDFLSFAKKELTAQKHQVPCHA